MRQIGGTLAVSATRDRRVGEGDAMATVRRRLYKNKWGKVTGYRWVVNYTDSNRKRHELICPKGWTKSQAQARRAQYELDPGGDPRRPFDTIAGEWLRFVATKI